MSGAVLYSFRADKPTRGNIDLRISALPTGGFAWGVVEVWHWDGGVNETVLDGGFAPAEELAFASAIEAFRRANGLRKG